MRNHGGVAATLGNIGLARVIDRVNIEMGHLAEQRVRPAVAGDAELQTGHPLRRTVHADVHQSVCPENAAYPAVERDILMVRRVLLVEEQTHRVTLYAKARLNADKDIAQRDAADKEPVGLDRGNLSGEPVPATFNPLAFPTAGERVVHLAVNGKIVLLMRLNFVIGSTIEHGKQLFRRFRQLANIIPLGAKRLEDVVETFRYIKQGGTCLFAHARRIVINYQGDLFILVRNLAQV